MLQFYLHHWKYFTALIRLPWPTALDEPTFIVSFFRITFLSLALFEYYILGLLRVVWTDGQEYCL